ncbi:MAG: urease accessory protein UreE [Devosia sp.]|jgi:urease accessory protein|uniref:urease accessory protein UreE n=1 Tax=unclassified Devosia TaxID=196773 RepID=UPI001A1038D5|nr:MULTISPECIES: urease accessory protein UreE [unclassified Devosia]MBF0678894.1 urease accessory protein UreE [Devosia sp.]WEJ34660.1 urease accessory protein UreE [Devosia sp. SD17-2]
MHAVIALHAAADRREAPIDTITLDHDERRVRRKLLRGAKGTEVLLDLPQVTTLEHGQRLELDNGSDVAIVAAPELLYEIRARDTAHLIRLAWHIGNRHTPAQLDEHRILIKRDHVLKTMLEGLGATVSNVTEPFFAEHGAYHSHSHADGAHALLARP